MFCPINNKNRQKIFKQNKNSMKFWRKTWFQDFVCLLKTRFRFLFSMKNVTFLTIWLCQVFYKIRWFFKKKTIEFIIFFENLRYFYRKFQCWRISRRNWISRELFSLGEFLEVQKCLKNVKMFTTKLARILVKNQNF